MGIQSTQQDICHRTEAQLVAIHHKLRGLGNHSARNVDKSLVNSIASYPCPKQAACSTLAPISAISGHSLCAPWSCSAPPLLTAHPNNSTSSPCKAPPSSIAPTHAVSITLFSLSFPERRDEGRLTPCLLSSILSPIASLAARARVPIGTWESFATPIMRARC